MSREVGEDFAVEVDVGALQAVDEFVIRKSRLAGRGADLDLPQAAVDALLFAAVFELKCPGMQKRFLGGAVL